MEHNNTGESSLIGFIISLVTFVVGTSASAWDLSPGFIHVFQCGAFGATMLVGLITFLNYCGINPFKKKKHDNK